MNVSQKSGPILTYSAFLYFYFSTTVNNKEDNNKQSFKIISLVDDY